MAQLNATINEIELKTNRLSSGADLAQMTTWNDEQYPTAALLRDVANNINSRIVSSGTGGAAAVYPIGSIIMTDSDTNPGQEVFGGPLPGRWVMVDQAFKHTNVLLTTNDWTTGTNISTGIATLQYGTMIRDGHIISLHLELVLQQQLSGSNVVLGNIKKEACGLALGGGGGKFYSGGGPKLAFARYSNDTSFVLCYTLSSDGRFQVQEVLSSKGNNNELTMRTGTIITIDAIASTQFGEMAYTACDRFYWKRTA